MIALALYVAFGVACVLVPVWACGRWLEWEAWDADRRIQRLRDRGEISWFE